MSHAYHTDAHYPGSRRRKKADRGAVSATLLTLVVTKSGQKYRPFAAEVMLFVLLALGTPPLWASQVEFAFDQANKLYEQGKYAEAAASYDQLIKRGHVSATILFNAGNALFKTGQPGRAIAAYRRAEQLSPRDPDVQANLNFVRKSINESAPPSGWRRHLLGRLTLNEWSVLAGASLWTWFVLLAAREFRSAWRKRFSLSIFTAGIATCVLAACLGLLWFDQYSTRAAVVIVSEAVARYGPLEESQSAFQLRDGAEAIVLDEKGDWLEVRDAARREGWLRRSQVILLSHLGRQTPNASPNSSNKD